MRYAPTEYLYASARIRALEAQLIGRQQLNRLLTMSEKEILGDLAGTDAGTAQREPLMQARLRAALDAVRESVPDPALTRFVQYPYDCHNLKVLEKCRYRGLAPEELLIDLGTIPVKTLLTVSENELFALLPTHLRAAVEESRAAFAKTADPQEIDFILDRAAFADMAEAAAPFPLARDWVKARIDLSNLLFCLRLLRMQNGDLGRAVLTRAALASASLDLALLLEWYDGGEDAFFEGVSHTPYAHVLQREMTLSEAEKAADQHLLTLIRKANAIPFGAEVPVAYLLATEADCKNLRILLSGKKAGLDVDTIQTRLRSCYV